MSALHLPHTTLCAYDITTAPWSCCVALIRSCVFTSNYHNLVDLTIFLFQDRPGSSDKGQILYLLRRLELRNCPLGDIHTR